MSERDFGLPDDEMQYREELDAAMDDAAARRDAYTVDIPNCPKCGRPTTGVLGQQPDGRREAWCEMAHCWLVTVSPA
jgi:hypothetical protein